MGLSRGESDREIGGWCRGFPQRKRRRLGYLDIDDASTERQPELSPLSTPFTATTIAKAIPIAIMQHSIAVATILAKVESLAFMGLCPVVDFAEGSQVAPRSLTGII